MKCEHGNAFVAWVSPSGGIFHVCMLNGKWTLFPGAPAPGYTVGGRNYATESSAAVGAGWLPLGW